MFGNRLVMGSGRVVGACGCTGTHIYLHSDAQLEVTTCASAEAATCTSAEAATCASAKVSTMRSPLGMDSTIKWVRGVPYSYSTPATTSSGSPYDDNHYQNDYPYAYEYGYSHPKRTNSTSTQSTLQ